MQTHKHPRTYIINKFTTSKFSKLANFLVFSCDFVKRQADFHEKALSCSPKNAFTF